MHACDPVPLVFGAPLGGHSGRQSSAKNNLRGITLVAKRATTRSSPSDALVLRSSPQIFDEKRDFSLSIFLNAPCSHVQLYFSFKIKLYQNKNQSRLVDIKSRIWGKKEGKDACQDSGQAGNFSSDIRRNFLTQIYRDLYGDTMLVPIRIGNNRHNMIYLSRNS